MRMYQIQYGKSVFDTVVFRPEAIKYVPRKALLLAQIKCLGIKRWLLTHGVRV